jgi:diguanylate cyclase (GGDEF)-like protein
MTAAAEARRMPTIHAPAKVVALAAVGFVVTIGLLAYAIAASEQQARSRVVSSFELRGTSSATFVSTFLSQEPKREPRDSRRVLAAFAEHTISYRQHQVFLVNSDGALIAASPATGAATLAQADPALARSAARASNGPVLGASQPSTFTVAPVAGTAWRLLIAVPNSRLYASIAGWTDVVPWLVFGLVSILGLLLVVLLGRSHADRTRLRTISTRLEQTARTDALTGLLNRRALTEELIRATAQARRRGESLSVLMIDLDRFKETNDRFGHEAGDRVLRAVARCMGDTLRGEDAYGRWGGDEFLITLPAADEGEARAVGRRLHAAAAGVDLGDIGLRSGVLMSIGTATVGDVQMTPDEIVRMADLDLYRVKSARHGRTGSSQHELLPSLGDAAAR